MLMTYNRHDFYEIERIAKHYDVKFRFDPIIGPGFDGNTTPLNLRVPVEEAVQKEFSGQTRVQKWKTFWEKRQGLVVADNSLYQCGSGQTTFFIDPYGNLQPCVSMRAIRYNLVEGDFLTGWQKIISTIRARQAPEGFCCHQCELIGLCRYCSAFFNLENGKEDIPSEYLCAVTKQRFNMIQQTQTRRITDGKATPKAKV